MMTPTRWQRMKAIVAEAEPLGNAERQALIAARCSGDPALHAEVSDLLACEPSAGSDFLDASPLSAPPPIEAGTRLGAFRVLGSLGAGGMGDVYLAERADGAYEEHVAIKVIRLAGPPGTELHARFRSETRLLAELRHPNIAQLLDAGTTDDGRPYIVMERIDGEPIDAYCLRHRLSVRQRLKLLSKVADAVVHAHRHLVIHRDLKPANILVTRDGVPKLLDFGVAKDLRAVPQTPETRLLVPITPEYASPELLTGAPVSTSTDVYSLGVVLYELLTGTSPFGNDRDPFSGRSDAAPPSRPSSRIELGSQPAGRRLRRQVRGDLDHLALRALAPEPAERYGSVEALQKDLHRFLEGLPLEARKNWSYRADKWLRQNWPSVAVAALFAAVLAGWLIENIGRQQAELEHAAAKRESHRVAAVSRGMGGFLFKLLAQATPQEAGRRDPEMERVVEAAASLLDRPGAFSKEPLLRAALLGGVGQTQRKLGLYEEAERRLRECLDIRRLELDPDDPDIARAANNLAVALRGLERYHEARELLVEAESMIRPRVKGNESLLVSLLSNRGGIEKELGDASSAVKFFEESLELRERFWPNDHKGIAIAHKNLAAGLLAEHQLQGATTQLDLAEASLSRLEESEPSIAASIYHHRGLLASIRGEHSAARSHFLSACVIREQTLGPTSPRSAESCGLARSPS